MGTFTDRVRRMINPKRAKQIDFNRSVGLKDDARVIRADQMQKPHDAYFIRAVDNQNLFVKFRNGEYFVEENPEMSCMWTMETGTKFLEAIEGFHNPADGKKIIGNALELVRMDVVLKNVK